MSCLISVRLSVGSSFVLLRGVVGVSVVGPDEVGAETDADFFSVGGSVEMSFAGFLGADASEEDNVGVLFFGRCGEVRSEERRVGREGGFSWFECDLALNSGIVFDA